MFAFKFLKMILIADSGSTKCSWAICDNGQIIYRCSTIGFNPYFITSKQVFTCLQKSDLHDIRDQISQVFFMAQDVLLPK